jgi:PAS domain S-box-containing protein
VTTDSTESQLRKTGVSVVGDVPWGTHFCYFYETKQDLLDLLIPYFKTGLEGNEFCLWIISNSELLTAQEARNALQKVLPDLDRYVADRSLEIVGHDDWFLNGGSFDFHKVANRFKEKVDEALGRGYVGMRVNGSPAWLQTSNAEALRKFEEEVDQLYPNEPIIAACTYPIGQSKADFLLDVARNHQFAIARRNGDWDIVETPELIQTKAEIKRLNDELEQKVEQRTRELATANQALRAEITERKRAEDALRKNEEQLRDVIDTIPVIAFISIPDGSNEFTNRSWQEYTGLSVKDTAGWGWESTVHPDDIARHLEKWRAAVSAGTTFDNAARYRGADGQYRWFLVRAVPLRDERGNLLRWYGVLMDIEDRVHAEQALRKSADRLQLLSRRLLEVQEEERRHLARELHDEFGQLLATITVQLHAAKTLAGESARSIIEECISILQRAGDEVRSLALELRPTMLDTAGLDATLRWLASQHEQRTGIATEVVGHLNEVPGEVAIAAFRVIQEALTNVLRHAQAQHIWIELSQSDGAVELLVRDDGVGFDVPKTLDWAANRGHLGLLGMKERVQILGGHLEVDSKPGLGTRIRLSLPLTEPISEPV